MRGFVVAIMLSALIWAVIIGMMLLWSSSVAPANARFYTPEYPVCMMSVPALGIGYTLSGPLGEVEKKNL